MNLVTVFAHAGGWDEIALVTGPVLVLGGLLWVARRRALTLAEKADAEPGTDGS